MIEDPDAQVRCYCLDKDGNRVWTHMASGFAW